MSAASPPLPIAPPPPQPDAPVIRLLRVSGLRSDRRPRGFAIVNVLFIWAQTGEIERLLFWERNGVRHPDDLGLRIQTASRFSSLDTIGWLVAIGATVAFLVWFHGLSLIHI